MPTQLTGEQIRGIPLIDIMRNADHILLRAKTLEGDRSLYRRLHSLRYWTKRDWVRVGPGYVRGEYIYQIMLGWRADSEAPK